MTKLNKKEEIQILKNIKKELEEYIDTIDDRNSIKLQSIKSDMNKILRKRNKKCK